MKNSVLHIILLFLTAPVLSQEQRQPVTGKVVSETYPLYNVLVVNLNSERETKTDSLGRFNIVAKTGDALLIADAGIKTLQVVVGSSFLPGGTLYVEKTDPHLLDEAVVEKDNSISSESLGLVKENQKKYTPAERKLYTAGDFKPFHLLAILGGGMPLDPVFNAITGRTKMFKKAVDVERKEIIVAEVNAIFTEEEIRITYKIPEQYVMGFIFYCAEDPAFSDAMRAKNNAMVKFLMSRLAVKYLEIISESRTEPEKSDDK